MTAGLHSLPGALCLLGLLCILPWHCSAEDAADAPATPQGGLTLSHVYKIDVPPKSGCQLSVDGLPQDQASAGLQTVDSVDGENNLIFRHNIRVAAPSCDCGESEDFKSLMYRVNGLEEEVSFLKTQCSQGCCGRGGGAGVDTSCSGHGTFSQDTCSCVCHIGWEGPDCSVSSCPDECSDNGRCVDGKCVCYEGYTGEDCSQLTCPGDCNDKGRCVDGQCVCFDHFTGDDCSVQRCPGDCVGNGRCIDGRCICDDGFFGDDCSQVLGPQGLRLVRVTDVSLLVEWEKVRGAEYYVLTYHPEGDKGLIETINVANTENSYLITGLSAGVTYVVDVYAVIKMTQSEASTITATTDVSTVDGIQVLGQTEDSIQVDWQNPSAQMDFFKLTHANPRGHEESTNVYQSQEARTRHTIVGLQPGTEYLITVQAVKGSAEGKASSVTGVTELDAPTNLVTRKVTESSASVSWDRVQAEVDGYMLSYSSTEGSSREISVGDVTSYKLTGLKPGVVYTIYIWAYKGSRSSSKVSTQAETEIDAPKNLRAEGVTMDSATMLWQAPLADIKGYILTYRAEDGSTQTVEKRLGRGEKFTMKGLEMGKSYIVTVIAFRGNKRSKVVEYTFKTVGLMYPFPMDCTQIMRNGNAQSGVYTIYLHNDKSKPMEVYCDMETDGGGWLVIQRRTNGRMDFMKRWRQYAAGFGNLTEEFWLGLEKIHEITNGATQYEIRFDLAVGNEKAYAVYDNFKIAPVKQKFKLTIGNYHGNAGDAMTYHNGYGFSTVDNDNDIALGNCALVHRGAWWYKNCHLANLNGKFGDHRHSMGVNWEPWKGHLMSLDSTDMKIRPVGFSASRSRRSVPRRGSSRATPEK